MEEQDVVVEATSYISTQLDQPVSIRPCELEKYPPISVPKLFEESCKKFGSRGALYTRNGKKWDITTYSEYRDEVRTCAKAFIKLGLKPRGVVCILGANSPHWFIANLAAIYAGGVACGIYATNSGDASLHCLNNSQATILVVENEKLFGKVFPFKNTTRTLKSVVVYGGESTSGKNLTWEELMKMGRNGTDEELKKVLKEIPVNKCCTLMYTSITTQTPKGVMLSHDNVTYNARKTGEVLQLSTSSPEVYLTYLPLSHVVGNMIDIHTTYVHGVKVYFAGKDPVKGSLFKTFADVRPTRILSIPRVWEKLKNNIETLEFSARGMKKRIMKSAKKSALNKNLAKDQSKRHCGGNVLAEYFFLHPLKDKLGMIDVKTIHTGAAPLSSDVKRYFASLDILLLEGYGMSETSGVHSINTKKTFKLDSCGRSGVGVVSKLLNVGKDGHGELCLYGRHVFMGYLNEEKMTKESLFDDGFLKTGDLAMIDKKGFIYITGRTKEILITADGEKVTPYFVEENVKKALPFLSTVTLIGDKKKFLTVLITIETETDEEGLPTDMLSAKSKRWIKSLGMDLKTVTDIFKTGPDERINESIKIGLTTANKMAVSNTQKIQKYTLLPTDFSSQTGELGPTGKLRRNYILEKYHDVIDKMYEDVKASKMEQKTPFAEPKQKKPSLERTKGETSMPNIGEPKTTSIKRKVTKVDL